MKIHDFGLWFKQDYKWFTTVPPGIGFFTIFYDGCIVAAQWDDFDLDILATGKSFIVKLKDQSAPVYLDSVDYRVSIGRKLSFDDFEIIKNPAYEAINEDL
jgi:hypothetical protein